MESGVICIYLQYTYLATLVPYIIYTIQCQNGHNTVDTNGLVCNIGGVKTPHMEIDGSSMGKWVGSSILLGG